MRILVIHGPNLNLLGEREPGISGKNDLAHVNGVILTRAKELGVECEVFQSNHEGEILDRLHEARHAFDGVVLNAGAYTHYSYAIYDALRAVDVPAVEVHISDITAREPFRAVSVTAPACVKTICGHGLRGYLEAMDYLKETVRP